jgi:hypothetical protein
MLADMLGSLQESCKAGGPDEHIGTNGKALEDQSKLAFFDPQGLSIKSLSDPLPDQINSIQLLFCFRVL